MDHPTSQVQYAGFGRRLLAYNIDALLVFIISLVIQNWLGRNPFAVFKLQTLEELQQMQASTSGTLISLLSLGFYLFYLLIFWVNYDGATPGKRLLAIKITRDDGSKMTYSVGLIRFISTFVSLFPLGLGYLWIIWSKSKQAWHDKLSKTIVVKTGEKPKTFLVVILSILSILFFFSYIGLSFYKGFRLAREAAVPKQEMAEALRSTEEAIEEMTPEVKAHWERSQALFTQMRESNDPEKVRQLNDENIKELKAILELEPDNHRVWLELGNTYTWVSSEGSLEDGLEAYEKAEELSPKNVVYINNVGDMLIRMERYEEAVLQFQKTLRLTNDSGYANLSLGSAYKALGIYDSAREHFQEAIRIFESENKEGRYDDKILRAKKEISSLLQ